MASASGAVGSPWACSHASARNDCRTVIVSTVPNSSAAEVTSTPGTDSSTAASQSPLQRRRHALTVAHRADLTPPRRPAGVPRIAVLASWEISSPWPHGPRPGVQVDDADPPRASDESRAGGSTQPAVGPDRSGAAVEDPARVVVLAAADDLLEASKPTSPAASRSAAVVVACVVVVPRLGHEQVGDVAVRRRCGAATTSRRSCG